MSSIKKLIPPAIRKPLFSAYHFLISLLGAILYSFPGNHITVIAVTGTKGKSSTTEFINSILETAGKKTALVNTIRFKIAETSERNTTRMTTPGRFFLQRFLRRAVDAGCTFAVLEMSSEGAVQHRHRFIGLNALVFTNIAPEHIESHGSFEKYLAAKLSIAQEVLKSHKRPRIIVANVDDKYGMQFLSYPVESAVPYSLESAAPYSANETGGTFTLEGTHVSVNVPGLFNVENAIGAALVCRELGISPDHIARGIERVTEILGRAQKINEGQSFPVLVDYAHTPDSLVALYDAFAGREKICVLGSTGGGRDTWKRPEMGKIAGRMCDVVILTNEDPYDEAPENIIASIERGVREAGKTPHIIMDRREAIRSALTMAKNNSVVLITGKGTDPTIQGPRGTSIPWSDAEVVREELRAVISQKV